MKFKEFFARYQFSAEGRHYMGEQRQANLEDKYIKSGAKRYGYSMDDFLQIRKEQMRELHNVYGELGRGQCNRLMHPRDIGDTSEEGLRRITGPNMTYNTGFIALDQNDRSIISKINSESLHKGLRDKLLTGDVEKIVDSVEALHAITERATNQYLPISKTLQETDVLQTEMSRVSQSYRAETYSKYAEYHPPAKGFLSKVFKAIDKAVNPEKYAEMERRFDNQEVPGIE